MNATVVDRDTAPMPVKVRIGLRQLAIYAGAAIVVLGVAAYAHHWLSVGRYIESTDDAYVGGDITVIAPKVAGFIQKVEVSDNEAVEAGELLVKLDDRDYRAALVKADAAAEAQRATLANLDATARLQLAIIGQANAGVAAADAEVTRSRDDQVRFRDLSEHAAASVQVSQKADADYKQAVAQLHRARSSVDAALRQLEVIDTQKRQTQAALGEAVASADIARLNLSYTELRAPIAGTVGNRSARTGAFASVGAQLVAIVPARGLWVDANFKESQLAKLRPGLTVSIKADVLPGVVFHGHVDSLAPATGTQFSVLPTENATGNFTKIVQRVPVRIRLDGDAGNLGLLRPGLSVTANIDERAPPGDAAVAAAEIP